MKYSFSTDQKKIIDHKEGPILVIAGPGSGKTTVLTERVRRLISNDNDYFKVLCLTFTNKAADEMRNRLSDIADLHERAFIGTIHSFCVEILLSRGKTVGISSNINIFEKYHERMLLLNEALIKHPYYSSNLDSLSLKEKEKFLKEKLEDIAFYKRSFISPDMADSIEDQEIYRAYNQELRNSNSIDYDDILYLTYQLLNEKPKIADFIRRQYRYICVDEAQDLNEAQYRLIKEISLGNSRNILLVGDPKQAIFTWMGSGPKYLDMFKEDFTPTIIELRDNYRSSQVVNSLGKKLYKNFQVSGQLPIKGESFILVGKNECDEAQLIADYLERVIIYGDQQINEKITLDKCAIIARNRYLFNELIDELRKSGIEYNLKINSDYCANSDLMESFEIGLKLLTNPKDKFHLNLLFKIWNIENKDFNLDYDGIETLLKEINSRISIDSHKTVIKALSNLITQDPDFSLLPSLQIIDDYAKNIDDIDEKAAVLSDLDELKEKYGKYLRNSKGGSQSLRGYLKYITFDTSNDKKTKGVSLLTIHSAKGLEFELVILMGMTEGTFPDYRAIKKGDEFIEEERREAFVSVTRSKCIIGFSYPEYRKMPWGDLKKQTPSRFLREMDII